MGDLVFRWARRSVHPNRNESLQPIEPRYWRCEGYREADESALTDNVGAASSHGLPVCCWCLDFVCSYPCLWCWRNYRYPSEKYSMQT